jgi:hypothetical protein
MSPPTNAERRARAYATSIVNEGIVAGQWKQGSPQARSAWSEAYIQRWRSLHGQSVKAGPS